jgi:hypothetical protein
VTTEQVETMKALRDRGSTYAEIARQSGCSTTTVRQYLVPGDKEKGRAAALRWQRAHKGMCAARHRKWLMSHTEQYNNTQAAYRAVHREELAAKRKAYYWASPDEMRSRDRECYRQYLATKLIKGARERAKGKGLPFDLDEHKEEIAIRVSKMECEASGLPLRVNDGRFGWDSPSIDRMDPEKGYVYENIRIISWALNTAFSHWGEDVTRCVMSAWLGKEEAPCQP